MAANTSFQTAPVTTAVQSLVNALEAGVVQVDGSFKGFGTGGSPQTAANIRGGWVASVTWVSAGRYRVVIAQNIPNNIATSTVPGLIAEAKAWVCSESITTAPASVFTTGTSAYDTTTNLNSFDIFCYVAGSLTDVSTADRVFFDLKFKNTALTP